MRAAPSSEFYVLFNTQEEAFYHIYIDMIKRDCLSVLKDFKYAAL